MVFEKRDHVIYDNRTLLDELQQAELHLYYNAGTGYMPLTYEEVNGLLVGPIPKGWNKPTEKESDRRDMFGRRVNCGT